MIAFALPGLEKAINYYLRLDEENLSRMAALEGKIIQFSVTDWNIHFYIYPETKGVRLSMNETAAPDTIIAGPLFGLFKAGLAKGAGTALFANSIEISGDTNTGEKIRHLMMTMDIDWEEHLSKLVGDIAAHKMAVGVKHTIELGKTTARTLCENFKEFLQTESMAVPTQTEVEKFIDDVNVLQHDVARAEARLHHLHLKRKSSQ
jgi:ubiquinone biosynthesis protein UbiJ